MVEVTMAVVARDYMSSAYSLLCATIQLDIVEKSFSKGFCQGWLSGLRHPPEKRAMPERVSRGSNPLPTAK